MTLVEQYAEICEREKEIQLQKKVISEALLQHFSEKKVKRLDTTIGKLTVVRKKVYELSKPYREAITELKNQTKELTKEAEEDAEEKGNISYKEHLLFTKAKE